MNNKPLTTSAGILVAIALLCNSIIATQVRYGKYAFRDEFNKASNAPIDSSKWTAEIGGGGWGNEELQYYTNDIENAYHENTKSRKISSLFCMSVRFCRRKESKPTRNICGGLCREIWVRSTGRRMIAGRSRRGRVWIISDAGRL